MKTTDNKKRKEMVVFFVIIILLVFIGIIVGKKYAEKQYWIGWCGADSVYRSYGLEVEDTNYIADEECELKKRRLR